MNIKITRKRIKNIILKVNDEGEVLISAPLKVPKEYIEKLIKEKEEWIREKLSLVQKRKQNSLTYNEGEKFIYLGKEYLIEIKNSQKKICQLSQDKFIIYIQKNTLENRKKLVDRWIYENFYPYIIDLTMNIGEKIGYLPSVIKFRNMKTRWGSCNTIKKSITFNHQLYRKPIVVVEYVVLHELAHIPFPHHQKSFWSFVEKYMPDWKERRKLLKE